jgi:hypothetical protein
MRGVTLFRSSSTGYKLDLRIVSARYGLLKGSDQIRIYDSSFSGLSSSAIRHQAEELEIPRRIRALLGKPYALALLLLGNDYMHAVSMGPHIKFAGPTIAFGGTQVARRLQAGTPVKVVPAGNKEARRFSCGVVGLKGELAGRLLQILADQPEFIARAAGPGKDILDLLDYRLERAA